MRADRDGLLKPSDPGLAHHDGAGFPVGFEGDLGGDVEIALGPGSDDVGDVTRVAAAVEQMIGAVERDEALGMLCGKEDLARIVDADHVVRR